MVERQRATEQQGKRHQRADIKDLKERINSLEEALHRAERASFIKSEYLENMSHTIRTAVNGVVGMTTLLQDTDLNPEQGRYLEMINISVDRLLEGVGEVLDYAKIEAGQLELESCDFNLKGSLDNSLYLLSLAAEQKGITLRCEIDKDVPENLHGDPKRLVQVLTNLINNSIKYSESGDISIQISNEGYDSENNLALLFSVRDQGAGIDLSLQHDIIEAFDIEDISKVYPGGGVGVGLTICLRLVRMMGGEIAMASSDKGSRFWFTVPFKEVAEPVQQPDQSDRQRRQEAAHYALQGAKILLAEDEQINRLLTETILTQAGAQVVSVENGWEAVKKTAEENFALVLMDVQMPEMDGLEATRLIRKREIREGTGRVTVIALTALAMQGDREKCLQAGMDDYLAKPIDKESLLQMLTRYLTRTALVMVSNVGDQKTTVRSLVENGWDVTIAESTRSALYEVSLNCFDLVILETGATGSGGQEAARVIRKLEEYSGKRAYIYGLAEKTNDLLLDGLDGSLPKPITRESLEEVLRLISA